MKTLFIILLSIAPFLACSQVTHYVDKITQETDTIKIYISYDADSVWMVNDTTLQDWVAAHGNNSPAGSDREIQFNNAGVFGSNSGFKYSASNGFETGSDNIVSGAGSVGMGFSNLSSGANSMALGENVNATTRAAVALGYENWSEGIGAISVNYHTQASGRSSFAGGEGVGATSSKTGKEIRSSGISSFNYSSNSSSQTAGHGALADRSAILGGRNHNIESGNTGAAIVGGDSIKLTGTSYIDYTVVDNFAIWTEPTTADDADSVLLWDSSTKKVTKRPQSSIGGTTDAENVTYTPTATGDWPGTDPTTVEEGLDQLAAKFSGVPFSIDTVNINGWNMDTDASVTIIFENVLPSEILNVNVMIYNDSGTAGYQLLSPMNVAGCTTGGFVVPCGNLGPISINASVNSNIPLFRITGGFYDSTTFDDDTINRGIIIIYYLQ